MSQKTQPPMDAFKQRELEVLRLIAAGLSNEEIAARLFLQVSTVRWYNRQIYSKLGVHSRTLAVAQARDLGLLDAEEPPGRSTLATPPTNLPVPTTPFVGRHDELATIAALFTDPTCRLLTLVGPGGIGKTRLALQATAAQLDRFADGVAFVALAPLTSSDNLVPTIANALDFRFFESRNPSQQLIDSLRDKRMLLVLDNFEHLIDAADFLSRLLEAAPGIHVVVTSRERLNLVEEWVLEVGGLSFSSGELENRLADYSAVQLFVNAANRMRIGFSVNDGETAAVNRICQMVGGMPLALELAAGWVRTLSCAAIADEIGHSLDVLETSARNVVPRHQNIRAAFDPTWQRLSEAEREAFKRLSVFRGGFTREAAELVAGATRQMLKALVDKSLVQMEVTGRYTLHELLRQYAEEHLKTSSAACTSTYDAHCAFYAELVALQSSESGSGVSERRNVLEVVERELENFRSALKRALQQANWEVLRRLFDGAWLLFETRGRYLEGVEILCKEVLFLQERSDSASEKQQKVLARYLHMYAKCAWGLGDYEQAQQLFSKSLSILRPFPPSIELVNALNGLCVVVFDHVEARRRGEECVAVATAIGRRGWTNDLAVTLVQLGEYERARALLEAMLVESLETDDQGNVAWTLCHLSLLALAEGKYAESRQCASEAVTNAEEIGVWIIEWYAKYRMGAVARTEGNYAEAANWYQRSLDVAKTGNNRRAIVFGLAGLGSVEVGQEVFQEAQRHLQEALRIAQRLKNPSAELYALGAAAELLAGTGHTERAVELAALVATHLYTRQDGRNHAAQLLAKLEPELTPQVFAKARERGKNLDMRSEESAVLNILSKPMQ